MRAVSTNFKTSLFFLESLLFLFTGEATSSKKHMFRIFSKTIATRITDTVGNIEIFGDI